MKRRLWIVMSVLFAVITAAAVLSACKTRAAGAEAGTYYCESNGDEYTLTLNQDCTYDMAIAGETGKGEYTIEGEVLTLEPSQGGGQLMASLKGDTLTLTYKSVTYQLLKKIDYTVTFDTNGNGTVANAVVVNGKKATKPENPEKTGWAFIAWYTDKEYRSAYDFNQPVRGDLTLYARFVENLDPEFRVTFDANGGAESYEPVTTAGGKVYLLPTPTREGYRFAGWWVSHFGTAADIPLRRTAVV